MIVRVYPSPLDFSNLSLKKTSTLNNDVSTTDYKRVVVNKPWGYEYLIFENKHVAVWVLFLKNGAATSMHCHPKKRTSLAVLSGSVVTSTLESDYSLNSLDSIIFENSVFHSTRSTSPEGAFVMEVEVPPDKRDLVRLKDKYGRENRGYESVAEMSRCLADYKYCDFHDFDAGEGKALLKTIGDCAVKVNRNRSYKDLYGKIKDRENFLLCMLDNKLVDSENNLISDVGDIVLGKDLLKFSHDQVIVDNCFTSLMIYWSELL